MTERREKYTGESGAALVFAIGLLALLLVIGVAFVGNSLVFKKAAQNNRARTQARMIALSAVNRAVAAVMLYQQQCILDLEKSPENFNDIYSFSQYDSDGNLSAGGSEEFNDALLSSGKFKSLLTLPGDNSVVDASSAAIFNEKFKSSWNGKWVFFYDHGGSGRQIIGRAAWQVFSAPSQILAPVFFRGHIDNSDSTLDRAFIPGKNRWGREIDEVFLDNATPMFRTIENALASSDPDILNKKILDYNAIYDLCGDVDGIDDNTKKRWLEKWLIPEPEDKTIYDASMLIPEPLRFNISEIFVENVSDSDIYGQDGFNVSLGSDPWYARFGIDSGNAADGNVNSPEALERLTAFYDGDDYDEEWEYDFDVPLKKRTGLGFLRLIGSTSDGNTTFLLEDGSADLESWRKQIAANFNDYCDADSVPTSDIAAKDWGPNGSDLSWWKVGTEKKDPYFTGNEKSPYIYELGFSMALDANDDLTPAGDGGTFKFPANSYLQVNMLPIVKLANIYPRTEIEELWQTDAAQPNRVPVSANVDFGKLSISAQTEQVILRDVKLVYEKKITTPNPDDPGNPTVSWEKRELYVDITVNLNDADHNQGLVTDPNSSQAAVLSVGQDSEWKKLPNSQTASPEIPGKIYFDYHAADSRYPVSVIDDTVIQTNNFVTGDMGFAKFNSGKLKDFFDVDDNLQDDVVIKMKSGNGDFADFKTLYTNIKAGTYNSSSEFRIAGDSGFTGDRSVLFNEVNLEKITLSKIKVSEISFQPRVVLTGTTKELTSPVKVNSVADVGVDYAVLGDIKADNLTNIVEVNKPDDPAGTNKKGLLVGGMRNYDPRQNLNPEDWSDSLEFVNLYNYQTLTGINGEVESTCVINSAMRIDNSKQGLVNASTASASAVDGNFNPSLASAGDRETVTEPGATDTQRISTAYIRNAPMMSPWEIGFIHRGVRWQTLNLTKAGRPGGGTYSAEDGHLAGNNSWTLPGTSYSEGDGGILDYIKMTAQLRTYGKINVNMLSDRHSQYNATLEPNMINALFNGVVYGEKPEDFIYNSTRSGATNNSTRPFPTTQRDSSGADLDTSSEVISAFTGNRGDYSSRGEFLNYYYDNIIERFRGASGVSDTDASREEIIGKTINLLSAQKEVPPSIIQIVVVAQSIKDVEGVQVKSTTETEFESGAEIDSGDKIATKTCTKGVFDYYKHKSNPEKNVYFDEITGEVKVFVTLERNPATGRIKIRSIDYL